MAIALMNLDGYMYHVEISWQQRLVVGGSFRLIANDGNLHRENAVANTPEMQIGTTVSCPCFNAVSQCLYGLLVGLPNEQHSRRLPYQSDGPTRYQRRTDDAHSRIEPVRPPILAGEQRDNRKYRCQRISDARASRRHALKPFTSKPTTATINAWSKEIPTGLISRSTL